MSYRPSRVLVEGTQRFELKCLVPSCGGYQICWVEAYGTELRDSGLITCM